MDSEKAQAPEEKLIETSLPALKPEAAAAPAQPKTVLVVEDNELYMKLFHDLLEANG